MLFRSTAPLPPDRKITVREAAEIMHCSDQRVRDAIHDGSLKAERNGRRFFLSAEEITLLGLQIKYLTNQKPGTSTYQKYVNSWQDFLTSTGGGVDIRA